MGCALAVGALANLQAAGRGYAALGSIASASRQAFEQALFAGSALAESDFTASAEHFASSEALLEGARAELDGALTSSRRTLELLDVTGTVASGTHLLEAGEHITRAGGHVAKGLAPLRQADVRPNEDEPVLTLAAALQIARAELAQATAELANAESALQSVTPAALPAELQEPVATLQQAVPRSRELLGSFLDQSRILLAVLGAEREREYLLLLQNNHELRPTGGFIGSLALVHVDRGVVEEIDVQSVYDPDGQLEEYIAPPDPLTPITDRWYLRDANWFIDWQLSASKVAEFFEKEGGNTVDGIIAITPTVIEDLLRITGPITVPGYDQAVDAESFVAVTQDLVTYSYDRDTNRPKQFLADLTPVLLGRVFSGEAKSALAVLDSLSRSIAQKQLLLSFKDEVEAAELARLGWDGALPAAAQGFLHVNNANVGGHKSDQFVEQELDYRQQVLPNGDVEVVLTIRRTHNGPSEALQLPYPTGENPAFKTNVAYQRVLVPAEAELLEAKGFASLSDVPRPLDRSVDHSLRAAGDVVLEVDHDVAEWQRSIGTHQSGTAVGTEAGYTMFGNWFVVRPGDTVVGLYRYRVPKHASVPHLLRPAGRYSTYVAKQPGDTRTSLRVELTLPEEERAVHTVPGDGITQSSPNQVVYRGQLATDVVMGAVF